MYSRLAFHYLRGGEGEALEIATPSEAETGPLDRLVLEWAPRPEHPFSGKLYYDGVRYRLWVGGLGWYVIDPRARRILVPQTAEVILREERLWGIPLALCVLQRGDLPLHAAAVEVGGSAVILAAPGRYGKSTLAAAFVRAGHRVLSEDMTCVRTAPEPAVIPGPAMLRVRRDVLRSTEPVDARPLAEIDDRTSLALDEAQFIRRAGAALAFAHERYRESAEAAVPGEGRSRIHAALAAFLAKSAATNPATRYEAAHHFAEAGRRREAEHGEGEHPGAHGGRSAHPILARTAGGASRSSRRPPARRP